MRNYGLIGNVYFKCRGYKITHQAYEYVLTLFGEPTTVYVDSMKELRKEINKLEGNQIEEEDQIQVQPMQGFS